MHYLLLLILVSGIQGHSQKQYSHKSNYTRSIEWCNSTDVTRTQVLIIGAGISGLEAARMLKENGIQTLVIEARNRTGGRIWSIQSQSGHIFDLGAAWLHGTGGSIPHGSLSNPLWEIVKEANIPVRNTVVTDLDVFHLSNQTTPDNLEALFDEYMDFINDATKTMSPTNTLEDYAEMFSNMRNLTVPVKDAFYAYLRTSIEGNEATEMNKINAKNFIDLTGVYHGVEPVFHETGFHAIIDYITKDFDDGDIRFQQIVNKINYNGDITEVYTHDGHTYQADYVLITVPLGVLKGRQIEFSPPLPGWKLNAIDQMGYGVMDKVVLVWNEAWWDLKSYNFMRVTSERSSFGFGINLNKWNDRPALVCFYIGDEAIRLERKLTEDEAVEEVLNGLRKMFPNQTIPMPTETFVTHWKNDPFANGSYSHVSVNQTYDDMIRLGEPVAHKLLFLGEATSKEFYGYAHGALLSARREVTRLLYVYELLEDKIIPESRSTMINPYDFMVIINVIILIFFSYY